MFKNYLKVAFRKLVKNRSYVIINSFGLGIALACCITAYILVAYNIEFDNFHADAKVENIFRAQAHVTLSSGEQQLAISAPRLIAPMAAEDFAGIKRYMRFGGNAAGGASVSYQNPESKIQNAFSENVVFADSTLFDMFDFPLVRGSHDAFKDLHSVFIDEEMATKYFADQDPVGKVLTFGFSRGVEKQMVVGGVMKEIPLNSSIIMPIVLRFEHFEELRDMDMTAWGDWNVPATFFELENPQQADKLAKQFDKYLSLRNEAFEEQEVTGYSLVPFKSKINQNDITWTYLNTPIPVEPLIIFIVLAMMILLIACFNLTNTSIAMAATRLREIGVRKSVGAHRIQIITQLMLETVTVIFLSLGVGYLMSRIIVPEFTAMWQLPYGLEDLSGVNFVITLLTLVFFAAILAGLYPSIFSTKFHTVTLLKGNIKVKGTNMLTRTLVSIQFAISVIVLTAGVIFIQNTKYQEAIDFGYEKEQLLTINIQDEKEYDRMVAKASTIPIVKEIASTEHHIGWSTYPNPIKYESKDYDVQHLEFGKNYFETMQYKFIAGRPIDYDKTNDFKESAVVTREFTKRLGIQDDPLGKIVDIRGDKKKIVGVIEDFVDNVFRSADPEPFIFYATVPGRWRQIIVRADEDDLADANDKLEAAWKDLFPTKPYVSQFQEDVLLSNIQQTNRNLEKIFFFLTVLGGLLSASGIYSLASLNIAKRTKEIGIRKALGASVSNVVMLLNKEFVIILSVAGVLGSLGGYFGTEWLLDLIYAFYMPMSIVPIIFSALTIIIIGLSTTSFTIFRAAKANPVDTLRDE